VLGRKSEKVISVYSILASGESESRQVALFNPAQDGYFTDTTVPGDDAGGEVFRVGSYYIYSQVWPPSKYVYGIASGIGYAAFFNSLIEAVYVVHAVNHFNENTDNTLTPLYYR
jgi:hypothetical protein